ncbi:DUF4391 domain-containing protein [Chloroflexota bacterium]
MTASLLLDALRLPDRARMDKRVPKKMLLEHGAPTAADKRQINQGIEQLRWVAALKPTTIGVPAYQDAAREYLEIAVITLALRPGAKAARLTELVHRAVPYPLLLVTTQEPQLSLSLAHKRWSQGEAGKTVLDGKVMHAPLDGEPELGGPSEFQQALALARQPRITMLALYQGWIDCLTALLVARITGAFALPESAERAAALRQGLDTHARLQRDIAALRAQADREKQVARRVELNLEINALKTELAAAETMLREVAQ